MTANPFSFLSYENERAPKRGSFHENAPQRFLFHPLKTQKPQTSSKQNSTNSEESGFGMRDRT